MVGAAQALRLRDAENQIHPPVSAGVGEQPQVAEPVPIQDQRLAQELDGQDRILIQLRGSSDRMPVPTQQAPHCCAGTDLGEGLVVFSRKHWRAPYLQRSLSSRLFKPCKSRGSATPAVREL